MGFGGWMKKHATIRLDSHTLGNLLKNVAPAAGILGGPAGLALAGGLSAAGDLARGKNIGEAARGSIGNMGLAAGVTGGMGALKAGFAPSSTAFGAGDVAKGAALMAKDGVVHGAQALGSAAVHNPLVVGQVASGVMNARAQNNEADVQRQQMAQQQQQFDTTHGLEQQQFDVQKKQLDDREARRRQLQDLLAPILAGYTGGR